MLFAWGGDSSLARGGRKRKCGRRHPSGQLVDTDRAQRAKDDRTRTSRQPHRRNLPETLRLDYRAESVLGRLNLRGVLTNEEYDAGVLYAAIVAAYRATIEGPRPGHCTIAPLFVGDPRVAPAETVAAAAFKCTPELCRRAIENPQLVPNFTCGCAQRRSRYDDAFVALARAGHRPQLAVNRVAIHGREATTSADIVYLVAGLDALAGHFGLTRRPR